MACGLLADISAKTRIAEMEAKSGKTADEDAYARVRVIEQVFRLVSLLSHVLATYIAGMWFWQTFRKDAFSGKAMTSLLVCSEVIFAVGWLLTAPLILITGDIHASWSLAVVAVGLGYDHGSFLFFALSRLTLFFIVQAVFIGEGLAYLGDDPGPKCHVFAIIIMLAAIVLTLALNFVLNLLLGGIMALA